MIFDSHFHYTDGPRVPLTPLGEFFNGGCLVSRQPIENLRCLNVAEKLGLACAIFVHRPTPQEIALLESGRALAYKHLELLDHFDSAKEMPILAAASSARMPVILHMNHHTNRQTSLAIVATYLAFVGSHFPELQIVVSHLGGENLSIAEREAKINPRIYFEISCIRETSDRLGMASASQTLHRVLDSVGSEKILFGSDLRGFGDRSSTLEFKVVSTTLNSQDQSRVFASNAFNLFRVNLAKLSSKAIPTNQVGD